jgi:hypothetical protein
VSGSPTMISEGQWQSALWAHGRASRWSIWKTVVELAVTIRLSPFNATGSLTLP